MQLGTFSLSLNVKNIEESLAFYEKLGFEIIEGGHINEAFKDTETTKWRILSNDSVKIGLFQGMFDETIMTFNPKDVLSIQADLKARGVVFIKEADANEAMKHAILTDPDGNQIMFDQH